jgi:hypothetical protein
VSKRKKEVDIPSEEDLEKEELEEVKEEELEEEEQEGNKWTLERIGKILENLTSSPPQNNSSSPAVIPVPPEAPPPKEPEEELIKEIVPEAKESRIRGFLNKYL